MGFLSFFCVLFVVEVMFPEGTQVVISQVFAFAVDILEGVRAWFTLSCF